MRQTYNYIHRPTLPFLSLLITLALTCTWLLSSSPALAQNCSPVELSFTGTTCGDVRGIYTSGKRTYVVGCGLEIFDISDPTSPSSIGYINLSGSEERVVVRDNYAYVASTWAGLRIVDVSNPGSLSDTYFFDTPDTAEDVRLSGNTAYVADSSTLQIIDITTPSSPSFLGSTPTPGWANGVFVVGNTVYVADGNSGLRIIDVSIPTSPVEIGSYDTPGQAEDVAVSDGIAYVADDGSLQILDVSNPGSIKFLGSYTDIDVDAEDVQIEGCTAYVADESVGVLILDVTDPNNPVFIALASAPDTDEGSYDVEDLHVVGNMLYSANETSNDGFQIIQIDGCTIDCCDETETSCTNGEDDDCDGLVDCHDPDCHKTYYKDEDDDKYGNPKYSKRSCIQPLGYVSRKSDCDDNDPTIHPGAHEICDDGVDNDCDGQVDCNDDGCMCDLACVSTTETSCTNGVDDDCDGFMDCGDLDCGSDLTYTEGYCKIKFNYGKVSKCRANIQLCVSESFCDALKAGTNDIVLGLGDCGPVTIPSKELKSNSKKTRFWATIPKYRLQINCKKGWLKLRLKKMDLKCCSNPVKICVSIQGGPNGCPEEEFKEKRDSKGKLRKLSF